MALVLVRLRIGHRVWPVPGGETDPELKGPNVNAESVLAICATAYGLVGATSSLLQVRRMVAVGGASELSLGFIATLTGGYSVWLVYGFAAGDLPLIIVDGVGLLCGALTLSVAVRLRAGCAGEEASTTPAVNARGELR